MKSRQGNVFILSVIGIIALLFFGAALVSAEVVGNISFIDGRVDILKPELDRAVPLDKGAPVSLNDMVRTKSRSRAEITLVNGTLIRLAEGTRVGITGYSTGGNKKLLTLHRGKISVIVLGDNRALEIETPYGAAELNGDDFFFMHEKGSTWFYANNGSLHATSKVNPEQRVLIAHRNCVRIAPGTRMQDSCVFKDIDESKHRWDTTTVESVPVMAQLPEEEGVFTYTPLSGRAIDTPSLPLPVAFEDLACPQCPPEDIIKLIQLQTTIEKMGNFERIDEPCNPCEP